MSLALRRLPVIAIAALVALLALAPAAAPARSGQAVGVEQPLVITEEAIREHLEALQDVADAHGGNRSVGTAGYEASVAYAASELEAAGFDVRDEPLEVPDQPVPAGAPTFERTAPTARTYVEGADYDVPTPGATTGATGGLHLVDDACDFPSFDGTPPGAVVLVTIDDRCPTNATAFFAHEEGAGGLVLAPSGGAGAPPQHVDLGSLAFDVGLPTVSVSGDVAAELETLAGGATVEVAIDPGWAVGTVTTTNVVAERPGTSADVVMVGAHLDSVLAGPGINDNGSGVAGVLAFAEALAAADVPNQRTIRIGLWGAEEVGLVGSSAYVASLPPGERERIRAYLNVDMIGSPNWVRGVYDPAAASVPGVAAAGSAEITARFEAHFDSLGLPTAAVSTDGASDDYSFAEAGIPTGGLFTGAFERKTAEEVARFGGVEGEALDPCYHLACDTLANVDVPMATQNTQALAAVALELTELSPEPAPAAPAPSAAGPATPVAVRPSLTG